MDPPPIWIRDDHWEQMAAEAEAWAPEEACGLIAGQENRSQAVYPVENLLHSATRYRMQPQQQVTAQLEMLRRGWDLLAIYHSHPDGPAGPSLIDVLEAAYPEAATLIWSRTGAVWTCRAYYIAGETVREAAVIRYA